MGSVIDYIECPNCKSEDCYLDFYYKTGEEYCHCSDCGYTRNVEIQNREKNLNELTENDWLVKEIKNPWGCYRIKEIGNVGWVCGTLQNEGEYNEVYDNVLKHIDSVDEFSLSRLIDGKIEKRMVVSSGKLANEIID
jgi:Zn ribbon nucleic-acid-binding protein